MLSDVLCHLVDETFSYPQVRKIPENVLKYMYMYEEFHRKTCYIHILSRLNKVLGELCDHFFCLVVWLVVIRM